MAEGFPWWWVIGKDRRGPVLHLRINAQTAALAQIVFERSHPNAIVVSVAREEYRNDDPGGV